MNNPVKIYLLVFMAILGMNLLHAQDLYIPIDGAVYRLDVNHCEKELIVDLNGYREENPVISSCVFHPDGGLYIYSEKYIYIYGVLKNAHINRINSEWIFTRHPRYASPPYYSTIDEKGTIYLSPSNQDKIYYFRIINVTNPKPINIPDFKDLYDRYIGGAMDSKFISSGPGEVNQYHLWNTTDDDKAFRFSSSFQYQLSRPVIYYPSCDNPKIISFGRNTGDNTYHLLMIDHESQDVTELCKNLNFDQAFNIQMGTSTGFRQSPMRIDLDADNSSRHISDGYYDTLSTCSNNVRINDDDIDINTCDKTIDSIAFSLAYLEDEPITNEKIFVEDGIKTSPSRWVWKNAYGQDLDKIKGHLKSIKYVVENEKEYDHTYSFQRAVITTIYAGGDSTSSWAVIRLLDDAVNAGQDTTVLYCPDTKQINLKEYVGSDALTDGSFEQIFSGGDGIFQPGIDKDGEYLYIAGNDECYDTAVFTVQEIAPSATELDIIHLCTGGQSKIGFSPGKYTGIRWWDDSTGDSIVVQEDADVTRYVELTYNDCQINLPVIIQVDDSQDIAGRDTSITFCPAGKMIDLRHFLPSPSQSTISIYPDLQHGGFLFTPGTDPPGNYQYIVDAGGCKDTALITMVETATQELPFGPIYRCTDLCKVHHYAKQYKKSVIITC